MRRLRRSFLATLPALALAPLLGACASSDPGPVDVSTTPEPVGVAASQSGTPTCVNIQRGLPGIAAGAVKDTMVSGQPAMAGTPQGNGRVMLGGIVAGGWRLPLVQFDLTGLIPAGATITTGTLALTEVYVQGFAQPNKVYTVASPWSEGTTTWNNFVSSPTPAVVPPVYPVAPFGALVASFTRPASTNLGATVEVQVPLDVTSTVAGWYANPASNLGFIIQPSSAAAFTDYATSESTTAVDRPLLKVCYTAGSCTNGVKDGTETGVDCGGPCTPCPLATGQPFPQALAIDATTVYWGNVGDHTVHSVPKGGGADTLLSTAIGGPYDMTVSAGALYWSEDSFIESAPTTGGAAIQFGVGQPAPRGITADATNVYWANYFGNSIAQCPLGGCGGTPSLFGTGQNTIDVVVDAGHVYWLDAGDGTVKTCPKSGCPGGVPTLLGTGGWSHLATDGTYVYYTKQTAVAKVIVDGSAPPTLLATGLGQLSGIATDGINVYWTDLGTRAVMKCAVGGCGNAPTTITSAVVNPQIVLVDATSVYFADTNAGNIWQLPK